MTKTVCVPCRTEMRHYRISVTYVEHTGFGPYKICSADMYKCPRCGHTALVGFGIKPMRIHHDEDFSSFLESARQHDQIVEELL